jgi:hypothetical protein
MRLAVADLPMYSPELHASLVDSKPGHSYVAEAIARQLVATGPKQSSGMGERRAARDLHD